MSVPASTHDFERYVWRASLEDSSYWKREAGGTEYMADVTNRDNYGEHVLFLGIKSEFSRPLPSAELVGRSRDAWIALRFSTPTIAAHTEYDDEGNTLITYRAAQDAAEAQDWALRTVRLVEGTPELDDLRFELGKKVVPEPNGDQTIVYIIAHSKTRYDFLLHTSHVPFDGACVKALFTSFFIKLAQLLENPTVNVQEELQWGTEATNLLPCASEVMAANEDKLGEIYHQTLDAVLDDVESSMPRRYEFKPRNFGSGPTRRISFTFSEDETRHLLAAIKARGFTFNQVSHAAVTLVCALDNPPSASTPPDAEFVYYGVYDCRSRLAEPYNTRFAYPGHVLALSPIRVPVLAAVATVSESAEHVLLRLASIMKDEYARQRAYSSLLAITFQQMDITLGERKTRSSPPPPWLGPWYIGDGIGENHLQHTYNNAKGENIIKVTDFFVSLNKTEPGPAFRAHSWCGKLTLSADANVHAMPQSDVEGFVKQWAELLRLIAL